MKRKINYFKFVQFMLVTYEVTSRKKKKGIDHECEYFVKKKNPSVLTYYLFLTIILFEVWFYKDNEGAPITSLNGI